MKKQLSEQLNGFFRDYLCHGLEIWVLSTITSYSFFLLTVWIWPIFSFGAAVYVVFAMLFLIGLDYVSDHNWRKMLVNVGLLFLCYVPMLLIHLAIHGWAGFVLHKVKHH